MKIAYLILAHDQPQQLKRLINSLQTKKDNDTVHLFIHIDKKSSIADFDCCRELPNVTFSCDRIVVVRCGFSQVEVGLALLRAAIENPIMFDRFILITGVDYPAKSNQDMIALLGTDTEFVKVFKVTSAENMKRKVQKYYFYNYFCKNEGINKIIRRVLQLCCSPFRKKDCLIIDEKKMEIFYGSAYFALTRACVKEILELSNHKRIIKYFKTAHCSDELFFNTLVANSRFKNQILPNLTNSHCLIDCSAITYFVYKDRPIVFTEEDYNEIIASDKMFFRKATTEKSRGLLDLIDANRETR